MSDLFPPQALVAPTLPPARIKGSFNLDSELAATQLLATPTHDFHYLGTTIRPLRGLLATPPSDTSNTPDLYDVIANVETLKRAWQTLQSRQKPRQSIAHETLAAPEYPLQPSPPTPSPTQAPASEVIDAQLQALSEQLHAGTYRPSQLIGFHLPQRKGHKARDLRVPIMRDRVVERAIVDVITPLVEPLHSPCSFGFRPGLGINDAVEHVAMLRNWGLGHVLRADFHRFFPSIRMDNILQHLAALIPCQRTLFLIRLVASPRRARGERRTRSRGLAQGSSLSPLLANIALTDFDVAVSQAGFGYARFADDFVVCAESRTEILSALELVRDLASGLHLQLSEEKTMMTTFDEGFAFLGRELSSSEPRCIQGGAGKRRPDEVLYVGREDARIRLAKGRLVIEGPEGLPLMSVPKNTISRVVVSGTVGMSAGVRSWALSTGATVVFLSRRGSYLGHLEGRRSERDAQRLLAQMRMSDSEERRLPLARAVVAAKMRHQVNVLLRLARRSAGGEVRGAAQGIRALIDEVSRVSSVEELLGMEGAASAAYFEAVSTLLPAELGFSGRNRRPPRDVTNAALSYGYAILLSECTGALVAAGLEPSLGVLHSSTGKRPSLALDLMEEFRPLLVDRTVFGLVRSKRLRCEHGTPADHAQEGVWLNRSGKKALVDGYEATLQRSVKGALPGFAGSWRRHIHHEAQLLARAIVEPDYVWRGVAWR